MISLTRVSGLVFVVLSGCTASVRGSAAVPRPRIDLPASNLSLGLDARSVPDQFTIPEQSGIRAIEVEGWRTTVQAGFRNGPARFFAAGQPPDYTLKFLSVDLVYVPVAVRRDGGAVQVVAQVSYMAQLVDKAGQVTARTRGEATSKSSWQSYESERVAAEAVAAMYEDIADRLLAPLASGVPAAGTLPSGEPAAMPPAPPPPPPAAMNGDAPGEEPARIVRYEKQRRYPLLIAGGATFTGSWLYGLSMGALSTRLSCASCYAIPVAGPLIAEGTVVSPSPIMLVFAGIIGAAQVTGLTLAAIGFFTKREVEIEEPVAAARPAPLRWAVAPYADGASAGLSLLVTN